MSNQENNFQELRNVIKKLLKEQLTENKAFAFDTHAAIEASYDDGYDKIKKYFAPVFDFDFKELYLKGYTNWESQKLGDIFCSLEKGNVWTVTCRIDNDYFGKQSTYDLDEGGLAYCVMAALRDLIKDIDNTFVNQTGE